MGGVRGHPGRARRDTCGRCAVPPERIAAELRSPRNAGGPGDRSRSGRSSRPWTTGARGWSQPVPLPSHLQEPDRYHAASIRAACPPARGRAGGWQPGRRRCSTSRSTPASATSPTSTGRFAANSASALVCSGEPRGNAPALRRRERDCPTRLVQSAESFRPESCRFGSSHDRVPPAASTASGIDRDPKAQG